MDELQKKLKKCSTLEYYPKVSYRESDRIVEQAGMRHDCYMEIMVELEIYKIKENTNKWYYF
jgi:hypothetical protein